MTTSLPHLLKVSDLDSERLLSLLESAIALKADPAAADGCGRGRSVAILFEKPSLRTRFSLEAALAATGAHPVGAYDQEVGIGTREDVTDVGRVLGRYVAAIAMRTFDHARLEQLAGAAGVPVINALSDTHHPLQALADLMTIAEHSCGGDVASLRGLPVAWVGDGNNVANSLIEACALAGCLLRVACPAGFEPEPGLEQWASERGAVVTLGHDPAAAVEGAAAVYTDVWASMGREHEAGARARVFEPYRVTPELMGRADPDAIFLHCLPAHRGQEVSASVIDGPASRVIDQAENRMHTALALFVRLFREE
ncbi:MAG TPA: ornithine carbamoyltransferase [Actinomycetota bacterium]|nr:ornithine carbamoyltransferase [Actinomycetota bacterium]